MGHPFLLVGSTIGLAWLFASSGKQGAQGAPGLTPYSPSDPNAGLPQLASGQTPTTPWGGLGGPTSVPAADPVPGSDVQSGDNPFGVNSPSGVSIPESGNTPQFTPTFTNDSSGDDAGTSVPAAFPSSGDDDSGGGVTLPAAGAVSGFMVGGPVGAVVGAMVGALVGAGSTPASRQQSAALAQASNEVAQAYRVLDAAFAAYSALERQYGPDAPQVRNATEAVSQAQRKLQEAAAKRTQLQNRTPAQWAASEVSNNPARVQQLIQSGQTSSPSTSRMPKNAIPANRAAWQYEAYGLTGPTVGRHPGSLQASKAGPSGLVYSRHARGWTHPYPGHAEGAPPPAGLPVY